MQQARSVYGDRAVYVNVDEDPERLQEMLSYTGGTMQVPVIVEGETVRIGFAGSTSLPSGLPLFGGT